MTLPANSWLASMKPYPAEWERHDALRDGRRVFVRPLKPEDTALYPDFLADLTREDLRLRFLAPLREVWRRDEERSAIGFARDRSGIYGGFHCYARR